MHAQDALCHDSDDHAVHALHFTVTQQLCCELQSACALPAMHSHQTLGLVAA